jgi:ribosomal protein L37AE/L43A
VTTCDCGKQTRDDAYACDDCADRAARRLGEVAWLDAELETTITKQRAAASGGTPSAEKALVFHVAASAKRDALRHALVMAVRFCDEEGVRHQCPDNDLPPDAIVAMSRWLLWRIDGLALNDMGPEFLADIVNAVTACKRIIDCPPERRYAGPCPECSRDLYHRPDATQVTCSGCGSVYNIAEVNAWMTQRLEAHLADRLVTAHEGSTYLGRLGIEVGKRTIDKWFDRGALNEAGQTAPDAAGKVRRLFRWDDVRTLATRHTSAS